MKGREGKGREGTNMIVLHRSELHLRLLCKQFANFDFSEEKAKNYILRPPPSSDACVVEIIANRCAARVVEVIANRCAATKRLVAK